MLEQRILPAHGTAWQRGRSALDPSIRRMIFGPIRPMETPGLLKRLFGG